MLSFFIKPVRRVIQAVVASDSPRQLAAGVALGMVLGLMPKGNLIAASLCVLLFSLRVNQGLALAVAVAVSWASGVTDPFAHKLGLTVLSAEPLQASYASLYNLPLGPWLGFNNTVVTGSLLLGLYLAYPVYWLSGIAFVRLQASSRRERVAHPLTTWLTAADPQPHEEAA